MKTFHELSEAVKFNNWVRPSLDDLKLEYKVEYQIKPLKNMTNDAFPTFRDFKTAVDNGTETTVTPAMNRKISYRSNTRSKAEIISLIKGYASYPQFRNEKTIERMYQGFADNDPMPMPLVLRFPNGSLRIMGGNTRMDVAFQMGINPKVIIVDVPEK